MLARKTLIRVVLLLGVVFLVTKKIYVAHSGEHLLPHSQAPKSTHSSLQSISRFVRSTSYLAAHNPNTSVESKNNRLSDVDPIMKEILEEPTTKDSEDEMKQLHELQGLHGPPRGVHAVSHGRIKVDFDRSPSVHSAAYKVDSSHFVQWDPHGTSQLTKASSIKENIGESVDVKIEEAVNSQKHIHRHSIANGTSMFNTKCYNTDPINGIGDNYSFAIDSTVLKNTFDSFDTSPFIAWVSYHKTGNWLNYQLGSILQSNHVIANIWGVHHPRVKEFIRWYQTHKFANESMTCPNLGELRLHNFNPSKLQLLILDAPDFFCDGWSDLLPRSFKLVHFVRDPFDMCLSSYLYHSQHPTPEDWVENTCFNPCNHSRKFLSSVAAKIDMTMDDLDPVIELCQSLYPSNSTHYYEGLTSLSTFDGLRLETSRFIISRGWAAGGDILRMAANAVEFARIKERSKVTSFYMQNFMKPDTKRSIKRLLEFSFQGIEEGHSWNANVSMEYLLSYRQRQNEATHVTRGHISEIERMILISKLKNDKVLGPVLKRVQLLLHSSI